MHSGSKTLLPSGSSVTTRLTKLAGINNSDYVKSLQAARPGDPRSEGKLDSKWAKSRTAAMKLNLPLFRFHWTPLT